MMESLSSALPRRRRLEPSEPIEGSGQVLSNVNGHSAPLSNGHSIPLSNGHSAPLSNGHSAPLSNGHSAPLSNGHSAPLSNGHSAPLSNGHSAPLSNDFDSDDTIAREGGDYAPQGGNAVDGVGPQLWPPGHLWRQYSPRELDLDGEGPTGLHGTVFPIESFCSAPNLVLLVGPHRTRFMVSSECLGCASQVFRDLVARREQQRWAPGGHMLYPRELLLEGEQVDVMYTICCIAHCLNDLVPLSLSPRNILLVAIAAVKYQLHATLRFHMRQWLRQEGEDGVDAVDRGCLMVAAICFNEADMFLAHSKALILDYSVPYADMLEHAPLREALPGRAIHLLTERRDRLRAGLVQAMVQEIDVRCSCQWAREHRERYQALLSRYGPITITGIGAAEVVAALKEAALQDLHRRPGPAACERGGSHDPSAQTQSITKRVDTAVMEAGVCLDCFRALYLEEEEE
ncbi:hypothetical protein Trco_008394 [Trichoderma cornu-damae]|uniref:BTB domain-containing protein n=1 Tax=Trichoderma cornu-damae TaxID=654480 RepID=A0A9P8TSS3_9HYPO|nr:hypothetical protein Trco_008394 [Trichoderma cornu-damae]